MVSFPIVFHWRLLPPLISFVVLMALVGVSFFKGRGKRLSLLFAGICLLGAMLSLEKAVLSVLADARIALQCSRLDHALVVFFIPLYLQFTVTFLHLTGKRLFISVAYLFSVCLSLLSQSPYYLERVVVYSFGYYPKGGPLLMAFGAASFLNTLYCLYLLVRSLDTEENPEQRNKTKYIMLGLGGAALMAHVNFLPLAGIDCYPVGNFAFIPLLVLGFAILKHDLLDFGMAFQKGLLYSVLTGLLTGGYGLAITLSNLFFKQMEGSWSVVFDVALFVSIVCIFDPLKKGVQKGIDTFIFKGKYEYQKTLRSISNAMPSMLDLEKMMERTLKALTEKMGLGWASIMLKNKEGNAFRRCYCLGRVPKEAATILVKKSPLIEAMTTYRREATEPAVSQWVEQGRWGPVLKKDFLLLGGAVVLPMMFKEEVHGLIVLGRKLSHGLFTRQDLALLRTLANQCAISVENARAYQIIESLNIDLERMIDQRTRQLRKALEEKERAQELLIRSESLATVGVLVAGVAHELNNPLTSVFSLVQSTVASMEEGGVTESRLGQETYEEIVDDLQFSLKELARARDIVASLLSLSRHGQEYSEPVALNEVIRDGLKILGNQYRNTGIRVNAVLDGNLPVVVGHYANLGQVFLNIITNAIQAVDRSNGTITVRTRFSAKRKMAVFECMDNGTGIADPIIKDIFKPFYSTKEVGQGTGLGLYISHEIVRRHGGGILVRNNEKGGTTFQVSLPVD